MRALREWLVQHEWFILFCDPGPELWHIRAISPAGDATWWFDGDEGTVWAASASWSWDTRRTR